APPPGRVHVQRRAHHPGLRRLQVTHLPPRRPRPGEPLRDQFLGKQPVTDIEQHDPQAVIAGRLVELGELHTPYTLRWARAAGAGRALAWAIEGTRHYGLGLARHLAAHGEQLEEIEATRHVSKGRAGKSDPIDAVRAARELLARPHPGHMRAD